MSAKPKLDIRPAKDDLIRGNQRDLVAAARARPDAYACMYIKDGKIFHRSCGLSRLQMMGAALVMLQEIWDGDG